MDDGDSGVITRRAFVLGAIGAVAGLGTADRGCGVRSVRRETAGRLTGGEA